MNIVVVESHDDIGPLPNIVEAVIQEYLYYFKDSLTYRKKTPKTNRRASDYKNYVDSTWYSMVDTVGRSNSNIVIVHIVNRVDEAPLPNPVWEVKTRDLHILDPLEEILEGFSKVGVCVSTFKTLREFYKYLEEEYNLKVSSNHTTRRREQMLTQ